MSLNLFWILLLTSLKSEFNKDFKKFSYNQIKFKIYLEEHEKAQKKEKERKEKSDGGRNGSGEREKVREKRGKDMTDDTWNAKFGSNVGNSLAGQLWRPRSFET